jgi:3-isopropylmalate/(R)-2-methylmalate dehydratase small subunit
MPRIFLFGDNIDTDQMAPGQHMKGGIEALAAHCLEGVRSEFSSTVKRGDIVVGGKNFGVGSSREQAAEALKHLGVSCVIATSFAGIFYRNALNLGLPAMVASTLDGIEDGAEASVDQRAGTLITNGRTIALEPIPENIAPMLAAGGLAPFLRQRFQGAA